MTNLQKYPKTRDALNAWAEYQECGGVYTFAYWIGLPCEDRKEEEEELKETEEKVDADTESVLDAAEDVVDRFRPEGGDINQDRLDDALKGLCRAVWKIHPRVPSVDCGGERDAVKRMYDRRMKTWRGSGCPATGKEDPHERQGMA